MLQLLTPVRATRTSWRTFRRAIFELEFDPEIVEKQRRSRRAQRSLSGMNCDHFPMRIAQGSTRKAWKPYNMMKKVLAVIAFLSSASIAAAAVTGAAPAIFFTDLDSGPNTGGENNNGAYVTIYGNNFTASATVTVGGGQAILKSGPVAYLSYQKMTIQLGANAKSGNITVTTGAGTSNGVPFTIRTGNIYFVATGGNDSNNGSFATPWRTIVKAKSSIAAGDIAYIMTGVSQTTLDDYAAALSISSGGTAAAPKALVAYPGASVTIGTNSISYGMRTPAISGGKDYWVIAGIKLVGQAATDLLGVTGWRYVGNDLTCPTGAGQSACFHTDTTTNLKFYGNYVHNVGDQAGSIDKYYHAVYFTTNSNHLDVGWNTVIPNPTGSTTSGGCRAIQFYSTGGSDQYDLHVHDNLVHDAICDGINFSTVNPGSGPVEAYNNIVYHVGTGPDPYNGSSNYACVVTGGTASGSVQVYNNTFYDCGSRGTSDSAAFTLTIPTVLRNNIVYQVGTETYVGGSSGPTGTNNVWYGRGNGPNSTTANINVDPMFVNLTARDFHLQSTSPAKDAGINTGIRTDFDGIGRPQGSAYDVGAYEYFQGSATPPPNACDLNGDGVVNNSDVQSAVSQSLGVAACTNGDLTGDKVCNVVDVQRVINAALGQTCRVGP